MRPCASVRIERLSFCYGAETEWSERAKRWRAVSDGGEDQGAEEALLWGAEEEGEEYITSVLGSLFASSSFLFSASGAGDGGGAGGGREKGQGGLT